MTYLQRFAAPALVLVAFGCGPGAAEPATVDPADTAGDDAPAEVALPNQAELEGGVLTGGQPTEADLRAAAASGVTLVISLRAPSEPGFEEERRLVEELGMRFENVPVAGPDGVTADHAAQVDALLDGADGRVILHCASGNRAGAMIALRAFADGADVEAAVAAGVEAGLAGLEETVRARLGELCAADAARAC